MYHPSRNRAHRAPLDFNAPVRTESVADALMSEPPLLEIPPSDAESLLAELGLPARTVSEILGTTASARAF